MRAATFAVAALLAVGVVAQGSRPAAGEGASSLAKDLAALRSGAWTLETIERAVATLESEGMPLAARWWTDAAFEAVGTGALPATAKPALEKLRTRFAAEDAKGPECAAAAALVAAAKTAVARRDGAAGLRFAGAARALHELRPTLGPTAELAAVEAAAKAAGSGRGVAPAAAAETEAAETGRAELVRTAERALIEHRAAPLRSVREAVRRAADAATPLLGAATTEAWRKDVDATARATEPTRTLELFVRTAGTFRILRDGVVFATDPKQIWHGKDGDPVKKQVLPGDVLQIVFDEPWGTTPEGEAYLAALDLRLDGAPLPASYVRRNATSDPADRGAKLVPCPPLALLTACPKGRPREFVEEATKALQKAGGFFELPARATGKSTPLPTSDRVATFEKHFAARSLTPTWYGFAGKRLVLVVEIPRR